MSCKYFQVRNLRLRCGYLIYTQRNDGKKCFSYQDQRFLCVLPAFSITILECCSEGPCYTLLGQVSARASPLPSQCLPVFGSFFCSVICPDILKDMLKDVCVCVHMHSRGTLNSNLQLGTADDHGHILTSFQAKLTTLSELAVEQSWHLYEICATSSWLRMFKSQRGQFLGSKTHTNGVYCLMSF